MVARDRDEGGVARRGSRRPRDEDEKYTTRERRQGRTKKKVCKAYAAERDGGARFQSERVRETARRFRKAGMGDARGKDPPTQESRPLFGFKQGKGCKTRRGLGGRGRESRRARTGSLEMANAYGRSPEVRECKFYDQSGGLIRRRCALPRLRREGERDVRSRKTLGLAKHQ